MSWYNQSKFNFSVFQILFLYPLTVLFIIIIIIIITLQREEENISVFKFMKIISSSFFKRGVLIEDYISWEIIILGCKTTCPKALSLMHETGALSILYFTAASNATLMWFYLLRLLSVPHHHQKLIK